MSVNKVMLIGRLGQDPELKYTPNGKAVCNFSVATNESWIDNQGNKQEKTEWHRIVVWGKLAETCSQFLAKGSQCFIEGSMANRKYKESIITEIIAKNVQFLSTKYKVQNNESESYESFTVDDIPF